MTQLATTILTLLLTILPRITDNAMIASVIQSLISLVPIIVKEAKEVLPMVKNVIALLQQKDLTDEQLDQLETVSAQVDAAWDSALDNFEKENPDGKE